MKAWSCNKFKGHWPAGTSAVVTAETKQEAIVLLEAELKEEGLPQRITQHQLEPIPLDRSVVIILQDGEY